MAQAITIKYNNMDIRLIDICKELGIDNVKVRKYIREKKSNSKNNCEDIEYIIMYMQEKCSNYVDIRTFCIQTMNKLVDKYKHKENENIDKRNEELKLRKLAEQYKIRTKTITNFMKRFGATYKARTGSELTLEIAAKEAKGYEELITRINNNDNLILCRALIEFISKNRFLYTNEELYNIIVNDRIYNRKFMEEVEDACKESRVKRVYVVSYLKVNKNSTIDQAIEYVKQNRCNK